MSKKTDTDFHKLALGYTVSEVNYMHEREDLAYLLHSYLVDKAGTPRLSTQDWARHSHILENVSLQANKAWVARHNGEPVGIAGLSRAGELEHSYVLSEHRGKGIHSELIRLRIEQGGWFTTVRETNVISRKNMEKFGFALVYHDRRQGLYRMSITSPSSQ